MTADWRHRRTKVRDILGTTGTAAMFLVEAACCCMGLEPSSGEWFDASGGLSGMVVPLVRAGLVGVVSGGVVFALVSLFVRLRHALAGRKGGAGKGG